MLAQIENVAMSRSEITHEINPRQARHPRSSASATNRLEYAAVAGVMVGPPFLRAAEAQPVQRT